ncbi:MAG: ATP-dependent Lhr-like helicase, partial [Verrucomicrobiales bacterium]
DGVARVVYVSPLKALAVDIAENLERPLLEIASISKAMGLGAPTIRIGVRSGDTPTSARAAMVKKPPAFIVTTPESLYLMCTSSKARAALSTVDTVIVDEIHSLARDKRGSHLALTMERLDHICREARGEGFVRVGLSATQKPIATVANLLVGNRVGDDGEAACKIVDEGHVRELDLDLVVPASEMEAIAPAEQMGEIIDNIAQLVEAHTTTLIFVNTRRMAERISHELGERLAIDDEGAEANVVAHHGSLSKDRRQIVERRLRAGDLKALVATASLELGIDVGPVDLVCQLGSPRNIATFLQRVGRANHDRYGIPKGRLYPQTRDDLVECCALLTAVHGGRLDALLPPKAPLDILIQQLVAEVSAQEWDVDDLFALVGRASPYRDLTRDDFDKCLAVASQGVQTGRGVRSHWIHHDDVNGQVRGRRGARMAALTSGGAIPELGDYRVLLDPDDTFIGSVNEDWATESMPGDIFTLGTHSWRIRRIEPGVVRVVDAEGMPPTIPVWFGEAPGRTLELSEEVCSIRRAVEERLRIGDPDAARAWLMGAAQIDAEPARQVIRYLAASLAILGTLPTRDKLVIERFFDETGGMQLIVHSPHGARLNRGFGLALRKKFCKNFDFELQAAASDDAVCLSLGPQHSFPLGDVTGFLKSKTVEATLINATLVPPSPMFLSRWRWNLNRSLLVLRWKGGRKNPPPIQRMEADDMMAALFPLAAACQENVSGPIELPDHVIVQQTMDDTLREAMDVDGLRALVERIEAGELEIVTVDSTEPSPLCHELLVGKAFTFLDDAEAIDRRSRAVPLRRGLPVDLTEIGTVSAAAIAEVAEQVVPDPRSADELYELVESLVVTRAVDAWRPMFDELVAANRATIGMGTSKFWTVGSDRTAAAAMRPDLWPDVETTSEDRTDALGRAVRGRLDCCALATIDMLANQLGIDRSAVEFTLVGLENEGFAIRTNVGARAGVPAENWASRRLLSRMHVYSQKGKRARVEAATAQDFMRFLFEWQHLAPGSQLQGVDGLTSVVAQLQGWHAAAAAWEPEILTPRLTDFRPETLDRRSLAGDITWGRLVANQTDSARPTATKATPITLALRNDLDWLIASVRGADELAELGPGCAGELLEELRSRGARFHQELGQTTGRIPTDVEQGLWELVWRGLVHADSFHAVRSLFDARDRKTAPARSTRGLRRGTTARHGGEGRWTIFAEHRLEADADELAEAVAEQLLARWGVVFHALVAREQLALPWREVLWALRRLEARGLIRGGRFVTGFSGEQYALPEATQHLDRIRRTERTGVAISVNGSDPLNLTGVITPGERVPARRSMSVRYVDGLPQVELEI